MSKTYLVVNERTVTGDYTRITLRTTAQGGILNNHLLVAGGDWIKDNPSLFRVSQTMFSADGQGPMLFVLGHWRAKCSRCNRAAWAASDVDCECGGMMRVKARGNNDRHRKNTKVKS